MLLLSCIARSLYVLTFADVVSSFFSGCVRVSSLVVDFVGVLLLVFPSFALCVDLLLFAYVRPCLS